jgi:CelD/BcsL family acetyltransferase involved in cellulose biosynthesis
VDKLLDQFFPLKAAHMAAQGISNAFSPPGAEDFVREACHAGLADGRPQLELHALMSGDEALAIYGGVQDGKRYSLMINTYTLGDASRHSPGLVLLLHVIGSCADRGFTSFDIGVGRETYKSFFCREEETLVDSYLPLSAVGRLAAYAFSAAGETKRIIKDNPRLLSAAKFARSFGVKRTRTEAKD